MIEPEEFVRQVLDAYYSKHLSPNEISQNLDVGLTVVIRILKQYKIVDGVNVSKLKIEQKNSAQKVDEINDAQRKSKEKITKEDLDDLKIDLELFGKKNEDDLDK